MKKLMFFTSILLLAYNANAAYREIMCEVKFEGNVADRSLIYVNPGSSPTTRFSINGGAAEIYVMISHKPVGSSEITVHGQNPASPKGPGATSKTNQQVKMAELKTNVVSIPVILTRMGNKQAIVECKGIK